MTDAARVKEAFEVAFAFLMKAGNRDEYVYKSALTQRFLLGRHSLRTAAMFDEFRVGSSKVDIAILNGTSTAYEIKSERDSLSRLDRQLQDYQKVFANVVVVAAEKHVNNVVRSAPEDVGIMLLGDRSNLTIVREARERIDKISPLTIFGSVRMSEAKRILVHLRIEPPPVPNTLQHKAMHEIFAVLKPEETHAAFLSVVKRSRTQAPMGSTIDRLPTSLQAAALAMNLSKTACSRFLDSIETPMADAVVWAS